MKNYKFIIFILTILISLTTYAQPKGEYMLKFKKNNNSTFDLEGKEFLSAITLYSDSTYELYFASTGLAHKYSFGSFKRSNGLIYLTSDLDKFKTSKNESLLSNERCGLYRFVEFKNCKLLYKKKSLEFANDNPIDFISLNVGVDINTIVQCKEQ